MMLLLRILSFFLEWIYVFMFLNVIHALLPLRPKLPLRLAAFLAYGIISTAVIYSNDLPGLLGTLLGFSLAVLAFHRGHWTEKITAILVFYPALIAVNYLMQDIGARCFFLVSGAPFEFTMGWTEEQLLLSTAFYALSLLLRLLFWLLLWRLQRKYLQQAPWGLTTGMWLMIDFLMLAPFTAIFTIVYFMPENPLIVYPICLASIISSFGGIYLISYICASIQTACRARELEQKQDYYQRQTDAGERVRAVYHDMKNHLLILERQGHTPQTIEMIRKLQQEIAEYEDYVHTGNQTLDIILTEKAALARKEHIAFSMAVDGSGMDFLDPLDISTIFGNALDNAMEASRRLAEEERVILVKAGCIHHFLSILVQNSCPGTADLPKNSTAKRDPFLHGLGLSNMERAAARYGGQLTTKLSEQTFSLKILIPLPHDACRQ